jgi:molybdopterin/thiamine biosynthesis adenylyltransferase
MASVYLASAGVGELVLVDRDVISLENLHRQPIYALSDVGKSKAEVAAAFIEARVPGVRVRYRAESIDERNSVEVLGSSDIAVDCVDNMPARLALNSACVSREVPLVHTGGTGWDASEAVFWSPRTACLECLFPRRPDGADAPEWEALPTCERVGTIGAITGLISCVGAIDAIKLLIGELPASLGRILVWDGKMGEPKMAEVKRRADCRACGAGSSGTAMREGTKPDRARSVVVELCGGREFYIGGAFSPRSFARFGRELRGLSAEKGTSVIQTRVGDADVSLFRTGGLLVKGVSSRAEARRVADSLGMAE